MERYLDYPLGLTISVLMTGFVILWDSVRSYFAGSTRRGEGSRRVEGLDVRTILHTGVS